MKANVFDRELDNGDIEITCTLTDPPIVVAAPIMRMAMDKLVQELHRAGYYNLTVEEADKESANG